MSDRPNILILMPDQMRADCMSCAGHAEIKTPNIDRLAAEGVRFANTYTSCPVCMPARSSFLSGLFCHNHGQWGNYGRLPEGVDTFALRLQQAGYRTCHVGKSHYYAHAGGDHLRNHEPFMNALGWQDVLETTGPLASQRTESIMTDHWREIGCLETYRQDYKRRHEAGPFKALWPSPMPKGEALDDFVGRTAAEYIGNYHRDEPLLMFVGFGGPHSPWDPPAEWADKYDPEKIAGPLAPNDPPAWLPPAAAEHQRNLEKHNPQITPEVNGRIRALYYGKISHIDWWFGEILKALSGRGMLDKTAVILWSDHGEMLCDKGRISKSVFYEQSVHVPLVIRAPRAQSAGSVSNALVSLVDVFATILDIAGCEPKADGFGRSLAPVLADPGAAHHDAVFSEIDRRTMVRDERFKMVVDSAGAVLKLYDMVEDPGEAVNLVGADGSAESIQRLRGRMLDWYLATQWRRS